YNIDFHINAFEHFASELYGYTDKAVISFLDIYKKTEKNIYGMNVGAPNTDDIFYLAYNFSELAEKYNISVETCAEKICLERFKIKHGSCIDKKLVERTTGFKINAGRDKNQRNGCGCIESIDMGMYNTCKSGCKYCYANQSESAVCKSALYYNEHSPLLCGIVQSEDTVANRNVYSLRDEKCAQIQTSLF
ncbi:MAG: DUF1848 domain-containing protein, partial [Clostridiales bacterium]|nr:DUF1848 domain-containing protein [Clostridiales bacterium]